MTQRRFVVSELEGDLNRPRRTAPTGLSVGVYDRLRCFREVALFQTEQRLLPNVCRSRAAELAERLNAEHLLEAGEAARERVS